MSAQAGSGSGRAAERPVSRAWTRIAYSADELEVGDVIAYPAIASQGPGYRRRRLEADEHKLRDWLRVTRIAGETVYGTRLHPEEWEAGTEYGVYPLQLKDNGVLTRAPEVPPKPVSAGAGTDTRAGQTDG